MGTIEVVVGDITTLDVDAIVNAANESLLGGGGVDGAIHLAAGPNLLDACRRLNGCHPGDAKITPGFDLKARWVIHTVGPRWGDGFNADVQTLANCYGKSLYVARRNGVKSIAFPAISTGAFGFPPNLAAKVAVKAVHAQADKIERIVLCCFTAESAELHSHALRKLMRAEPYRLETPDRW